MCGTNPQQPPFEVLFSISKTTTTKCRYEGSIEEVVGWCDGSMERKNFERRWILLRNRGLLTNIICWQSLAKEEGVMV